MSLATWAAMVMVGLASDVSPYRGTFETTAAGIADAATEAPLFAGDLGVEQTIAVLLAIAWKESSFNTQAAGDCPDLPAGSPLCTLALGARALGLFQVWKTNAPPLNVDVDDLLGPPKHQASIALRMVKTSFRICAGRPLEERLGWYHRGGTSCPDSAAGRGRMWLAKSILARWPR